MGSHAELAKSDGSLFATPRVRGANCRRRRAERSVGSTSHSDFVEFDFALARGGVAELEALSDAAPIQAVGSATSLPARGPTNAPSRTASAKIALCVRLENRHAREFGAAAAKPATNQRMFSGRAKPKRRSSIGSSPTNRRRSSKARSRPSNYRARSRPGWCARRGSGAVPQSLFAR